MCQPITGPEYEISTPIPAYKAVLTSGYRGPFYDPASCVYGGPASWTSGRVMRAYPSGFSIIPTGFSAVPGTASSRLTGGGIHCFWRRAGARAWIAQEGFELARLAIIEILVWGRALPFAGGVAAEFAVSLDLQRL